MAMGFGLFGFSSGGLGLSAIGRRIMAAAGAPAIPEMTYNEMLSLPANTPAGTRVNVTDGFFVIGYLPEPVFVRPVGTYNGHPLYWAVDESVAVASGGDFWSVGEKDGDLSDPGFISDIPYPDSDVDFPWEIEIPEGYPTIVHPATLELAAPSSAQGGVFIPEIGIFAISATETDEQGGPIFRLLGDENAKVYRAYTGSFVSRIFDRIVITDISDNPLYYSLSDVATPDLASDWMDVNDTPASIVVISVMQRDLNAGVIVAGAGTSTVPGHGVEVDGVYPPSGNLNGRKVYTLIPYPPWIGSNPLRSAYWWIDNSIWCLSDFEDGACFIAPDVVPFPWLPTWFENDSNPPAPTVTRSDPAGPRNWQPVTP